MNTATIQITPRAFGNIAAAAMSHGCDVTTYLVRTAITSAPQRRRKPAPQPSPAAEQPELPLTMPEQPQPKAAPSSGMFDIA